MSDICEVAQKVEAFLRQQIDRYERILEMSNRQSDFITKNDTAGLMQLLSQKQGVLREVAEATTGAAALLGTWNSLREQVEVSVREELEQLHQQLKEVLTEVMQVEDTGREMLSSRLDDHGNKIVNMQKGKQMLKAYGVKKQQDSRFKDDVR